MHLNKTGQEKDMQLEHLDRIITVKVIMTIKAPRGMCQLYEQPLHRGWINKTREHNQCQAIKAFMKEHNG